MRLFQPRIRGAVNVGDRSWGQVEGGSGDGRTPLRQQKRPFAGLLLSPLTDSNRRPPPYHESSGSCHGLPTVAIRRVWGVFGPSSLPSIAAGCDRSAPQLLHTLSSDLAPARSVRIFGRSCLPRLS